MPLVASYFDPKRADLAAAALEKFGIPFERSIESSEGGDEHGLLVTEEHFDRAADVMEELEEALMREERREAPSCRRCQSKNLSAARHMGSFGEHTILVCDDCGHTVIK